MPSLPIPDKSDHHHSFEVQNLIRSEITMAGGWLPFTRYMELAIYSPGMGYYSSSTSKFGCTGDFVTAPEVSSLFGRSLARQAIQIIEGVSKENGDILEFGAGTGKLALDILLELENIGRLPQNYFILEVSGELQKRQRKLFEKFAPYLLSRVKWIKNLPAKFNGLILANEVLDAMPVHLVVGRNNSLFERGVVWNGKKFEWSDRLLVEGELFNIAQEIIPQDSSNNSDLNSYVSEISLSARGFIRSLADILEKGAVVIIDYGFGSNEYYHVQRNCGTLMCHYKHYVHNNPFYCPGLQDITSHVDFTAIADVAISKGLELIGYTTQAQFLINCGITDLLAEISVENTSEYLPMANQLQKLVSPAEMGELFKVIAIGRNNQHPLIGFTNGDKSFLLSR